MSYIVVYENNQTSGLLYGCRYYMEFPDQASVKEDQGKPYADVVASGVSFAKAKQLTALTPEICIFAGLIETYGLDISLDHARLVEIEARFVIEDIRREIQDHNLARLDATKQLNHLKSLAKQDTNQSAILKGYLARIIDPYTGQVLTNY